MKDFTILKGTKKKAVILLDVQVASTGAEVWSFYNIVGGFVWEPTPYYIMLGEEVNDRYSAFPDARGVLRVLDEHENEEWSLNGFLSRMTDFLSLTQADTLYSDCGEKNKDRLDLFYQFTDKLHLTHLRVIHAPFSESFRLSMSITQDWITEGLLRIPRETLLWNQLEVFNPKELESAPEKRFYRLRALSFAVCGLQKYGKPAVLDISNLTQKLGGPPSQDWMGR